MANLQKYFDVSGKTVLVTGGSRGIGEAIASGFVENGSTVYICSRSEKACEETARRLSEKGVCKALPADISTLEGRRTLVDRLMDNESSLDVLVNNAGAVWAAPFDEYPEAGWDKVYDLNLKALFFLTQSLTPLLERSGTPAAPARVINIGSMNALRLPKHETYAYTSSKAAVHHLSLHLADKLAKRNITVNVIAPGWYPSKILKASLARQGEENMSALVPLGRLTNDLDLAGTAIFLSSQAAAYLTGVVIPVDGGIHSMS